MSGTTPNPATSHAWSGVAAWNFKLRVEIASFDDCRDAFFGADDAAEWRDLFGLRDLVIGPNMYLRPTVWDTQAGIPDAYAIVLYDFEIVRYYRERRFSVECGDWTTPTTRERMQAVVPDGFRAYFHDHRLGLVFDRAGKMRRPHPGRARTPFAKGSLWPLNHDVRVDAETGFWVYA